MGCLTTYIIDTKIQLGISIINYHYRGLKNMLRFKKRGEERQTSQKKFILEYLKSNFTHPSAEIVYTEVKKKLPQISRGTVYRILAKLKARGEVREIPGVPTSRYDGDPSSHAHFICEKCGEIFDFFDFCHDCSILRKKKTKVGKIKKYNVYFYGECNNCQK